MPEYTPSASPRPHVDDRIFDRLAGRRVHDLDGQVVGEPRPVLGDVTPHEAEVEVVGPLGQLGREHAVGAARPAGGGRRRRTGRRLLRRVVVRATWDDESQAQPAGPAEHTSPGEGRFVGERHRRRPCQSFLRITYEVRLRSPSTKAYFDVLGSIPKPRRRRTNVSIKLGDTAPDFEAETTEGTIRFHDWIGDSWAVLFSHPKDFTPVCTTELGYMASIKPEFDRRNVKVVGLSVDPVDKHEGWAKDIEETQGHAPNYPIIADAGFEVSKAYGMLPAEVAGDPGERTPADNQTVRNVFVIAPDKTVKLILVYPMTTGRNFDEVLRVIDSLQLTAKHKVATPANWQHGDDVIIAGSVSDDEARETYPEGWESPRPYIRIVPQPDQALASVD